MWKGVRLPGGIGSVDQQSIGIGKWSNVDRLLVNRMKSNGQVNVSRYRVYYFILNIIRYLNPV